MTTIAFAAGVLAADSYASDECSVMEVVKCATLPSGDVAGGAGDLGRVTQALAWLKAGGKGDGPEIDGCAILFTSEGVCYLASGGWPGSECRGNAAIGSGAQGALVAMKLGLSAVEAVRAVAGVDPCTGGLIAELPVKYQPKASKSSPRKKAR